MNNKEKALRDVGFKEEIKKPKEEETQKFSNTHKKYVVEKKAIVVKREKDVECNKW